MSNINLYSVMVGDKPMVRYLMKQKGGNVEGKTSPKSAMWMLTNDKTRVPHMTEEFPGFPLTADGVYFFDGRVDEGETTSSGTEARGEDVGTSFVSGEAAATFPKGIGNARWDPARQCWACDEGSGETEETTPVCGPDYCDIPEAEEKPKRKRTAKKAKDVAEE